MFFLICQVFNFINFLKIFMPSKFHMLLKIFHAPQNRIAPFFWVVFQKNFENFCSIKFLFISTFTK